MLDNVTKRRIDNARQVLVGKVPDPKAQVEQITTALIYKFMDDMDQEAVELGGKASFFTVDYQKFAWNQVMDRGLGGHQRLDLYAEALIKMSQNPNLPQLFRDIFNDAFLPYRDPETLNLFLKEINGFTYDHSERLGDAFEYLLSVLGSQGAAGQFRTPRHIIDFIVAAVDPGKNDSILDPACGTAGFLISAYKHILAKNKDKPLSPDEMQRLTENFVGYDISPEMVRLSLVNMYLHQFQKPTIFEYDTLTSEERWDDTFDVILANPPFMSPKGGIRPHKRFSVQAKRSEVLFVDYIAEHLNPGGRAGIIVPEGIIFQTSNAYKNLRKMLVDENYLYAVVSLPSGVFNPYSGVKTSILLLDRKLAKHSESILFIDVENDGFGLGTRRREIEEDDLPEALLIIEKFNDNSQAEFDPNSIGFTVQKSELSEDGDYLLMGSKYQEMFDLQLVNWPVIELGKVAEIISGQSPESKFYNEEGEGTPFYQGKTQFSKKFLYDPVKWTTKVTRIAEENDILMSVRAPAGPVNITKKKICIGRGLAAIRVNKDKAIGTFIFYLLDHIKNKLMGVNGTTFASINRKDIQKIKIPLPPLEVQREIVEEIEGYQKIIDGARMVVKNYKPRIPINPDWPLVELGEVATTEYGHNESAKERGDTRFIRITDIDENGFLRNLNFKYIDLSDDSKPYILHNGDIVVARTGATYGKTLFFSEEFQSVFAGYLIRINFDHEKILNKYYWCFAQSDEYNRQKAALVTGGGQPQFNAKAIQKIKIPFPPDLETQDKIIAQIEAEQKIVDANKKLINIFEQKIEDKISEVWGESKEEK